MANEDVSVIGIEMQTDGVARGIKSLDELALRGPRVEKAMQGVATAAAQAGKATTGIGSGSAKGLEEMAGAGGRAAAELGKVGSAARSAVSSQQALASAVSQFTSAERSYVQSLVDEHKALIQSRSERAAYIAQSRGMSTAAQEVAAAVGQKIDALKRERAEVAKTGGAYSELGAVGRSAVGALAAIGIGLSASELVKMADASTNVASRLKLVTGSAMELASAQTELFQIAQQTRVSYVDLTTTYAQMARASKELGVSQRDMLAITKTISQAVTISGGSAQSAQAALIQLSQGFASGALRGEELNSVMEQTPRLAQAIAQGLGVTTGELRKLGQEGELTAEKVLGALQKSAGRVQQEFEQMTVTIEQSLVRIGNSTVRLVGELDKATKATSTLAWALALVSRGIDSVASDINKLNIQAPLRQAADEVQTLSQRAAILRNGMQSGFYGPKFQQELDEVNRKLEIAKQRFRELDSQLGGGSNPKDQTGYTSRSQSYDKDARRLESVQAAMGKVLGNMSGLKDSFYKDLNSLYAGYQNGLLKLGDYQKAVADLIKKDGVSKPDSSIASGINDQIDARIEAIRKGLQKEEALNRSSLEDLASMRRMYQVNDRDYIDQTSALEVQSLEKRRGALQAEMAAAATKKDSLKEVAAITGQIEIVDQQIDERKKKRQREINELTYKQVDAIRTVIAAQMQQDAADYAAADKERLDNWNSALGAVLEYGRAIDASNDAVQFELGLMGQGERSRAMAIAQYQVQVRLKERLRDIERSTLGLAEQNRLKEIAESAAAREMAGVQQRVVLDEWKKTTDEINRSLTDALLRGFEDGKGFAENMRDTVVNMFKTMVLRPIISAVLQPVAGGLASAFGYDQGGVAGSSNNVLGMAQNAQSLYNLYNKGGSYVNKIGSFFGYGGSSISAGATGVGTAGELGSAFEAYMAASGLAAAGGGAAGVATAGELGAAFEAYMAASGTAAAAGGGGAAAGAAGFSAIPIVGWILAGIAASNAMYAKGYSADGIDKGLAHATPGAATSVYTTKLLKGIGLSDQWANTLSAAPLIDKLYDALGISGGEKRAGGQYGYSLDGTSVYNPRRGITQAATEIGATFLEGPSAGAFAEKEIKQIVGTTVTGINGLLEALESDARITGFQAGLETSKEDRGGVFSGGTLTGGIAFGESGQGDPYKGTLFEKTSTQSPDFENAYKNFTLDLQQATIQALKAATDIPKSIQATLKDVNPEELTSEAITELLTKIGEQVAVIKGFRDSIAQLPFENLKALSYDTAESLITLAGGLDVFNAGLSGYYENFYSDAERTAVTTANVTKAITDLGLTMPDLSLSASAARAQFRSLVESLDVNTEKGREQYVALLSLQGAFAELTPAIDSVAESVRSATDILNERKSLERELLTLQGQTVELRARELAEIDPTNRAIKEQIWALQDQRKAADEAAQAMRSAQDASYSGLQRAVESQRSVLNTAAEAARESLESVSSLFDMLTGEISALRGAAGASNGVDQARQFIAQSATNAALTGALPEQEELAQAISTARQGIDSGAYASRQDLDRDRFLLASQLERLQGVAGSQKNTAQQQLDTANAQLSSLDDMLSTAKDQLDALRGIDTSVKSVAEALAIFNDTLKPPATGTGATPTPTPPGTVQPVFGGGGGGSSGGGRVYQYELDNGQFETITDPLKSMALNRLSAIHSTFNGTGDVLGLLSAAKSARFSLKDVQSVAGYGTYEDWVRAAASVGMQPFAKGTNSVPFDMPALVHEGERIIPAADNRALMDALSSRESGSSELIARVDALNRTVEGLQQQLAAIARYTGQSTDVLQRVSQGGNAFLMEEA